MSSDVGKPPEATLETVAPLGARLSTRELVVLAHNTVLVIDDEADTREALSEALGDAGYLVQLAANGKEGLDLLPGLERPCGVILDMTMPVMNGMDLYRVMKATPALADIPVVISTADPTRVPKGVPLMKKPVSLERLLVAVAALF